MTSTTKTLWQLDGDIAKLTHEKFSTQVALKHPEKGLQQISLAGAKVNGCSPLQVSPEPPAANGETIIDSYIRGRDLVTTYAQTPQRTIQPTYYWQSLNSDGDTVGVELMISMQTSLLESDPTLTALTTCSGGALWVQGSDKAIEIDTDDWQSPKGETGFLLFRLAGGISYAEMVFPSDFLGATVARKDGESTLVSRLFPEDLEKGVIRRGRIRALFLPTDGDVAAAWNAYEQFKAAEPPLTT